MKTAIVYYSKHHGNTKKLLDAIAKDHEVTLINAAEKEPEKDLSAYDRIGFASGIYYSCFAKPILKYAKENLPRGRKTFLIYTCGSKKNSRKYTQEIHQIIVEKGSGLFGSYGCYGHDSFGPLKLVGGIRKHHPNQNEVEGVIRFYNSLSKKDA